MDVSSDEEEFEISEVQVEHLTRKETIIEIKKAEETNVKTTAEKADMSEFKAEKLEEMKWKFKDQKKKLKKRMTNVKQDILRCLWLRWRISQLVGC